MPPSPTKRRDLPTASVVPVQPNDEAIFKRRYKALKAIVYELEDENNMIAYKIARLRVKIREKQEEQVRAREAEAAAWEREQRRSRKISTSDKDQAMSDDRLTPALLLTPHNGVRAHPHSSTGSMRVSTPAQSGAVSLREDEDDIMDDY